MRKFFILLTSLISLSGTLCAQEFKAGQQAQGLAENKHVTIDYATGTFHYSVPLYTVQSGDFALPLTLDYAGRGVRVGDQAGDFGYNWTLNTGGVISRTLRGGIADERPPIGYAYAEQEGVTQSETFATQVNNRQYDGEADLFTAVFNGKKVYFRLRLNEKRQLYAEPLEHTDVHIEQINGNWRITDDNGDRYWFEARENTSDASSDGPVSFNGVYKESYTSAWFLTKIEPLNAAPIILTYEPQNIITRVCHPSLTRYQYGTPLREHPFDFSKYRVAFEQNIQLATQALQGLAQEINRNNFIAQYLGYGVWYENPDYHALRDFSTETFRVMGILSESMRMTSISNEVVTFLDQLINRYGSIQDNHAQRAVSFLRAAKSCVVDSFKEIVPRYSKDVYESAAYTLSTPRLQSITTSDYSLTLDYGSQIHIRRDDCLKQRISELCLSISGKMLKRIDYLDKDSVSTAFMTFDYYPTTANGYDSWGYPKTIREASERFTTDIDTFNIKGHALKNIRLTDGGRIGIEYEPNRTLEGDPIGGIRLRMLTLDNRTQTDTVKLHYPGGPKTVFASWIKEEYINTRYGNRDYAIYSIGKFIRMPIINAGNNGLYYPWVIEEIDQKGYTSYWYQADNYQQYWSNGLLIGKGVYDHNGNLKQLYKYTYRKETTDESPFAYSKSIPQVKANDYQVDDIALDKYYQGLDNITLPGGVLYSPYHDFYKANILPHLPAKDNSYTYDWYYGGKNLLYKESEYRYEGKQTSQPGIDDLLTQATGKPYREVTYLYDAPESIAQPTRIIETDSKGDTIVQQLRYAAQMPATEDSIFDLMHERHLLAPVIKQAIVHNGILQKELVHTYTTCQGAEHTFPVPAASYQYVPREATQVYPDDSTLFAYGKEQYQKVAEMAYVTRQATCRQAAVRQTDIAHGIGYDKTYDRVIFECEGAGKDQFAAQSLRRYHDVVTIKPILDQFDAMVAIAIKLRPWISNEMSKEIQSELTAEEYARIFYVTDILSLRGIGYNMQKQYDEPIRFLRAYNGAPIYRFENYFKQLLRRNPDAEITPKELSQYVSFLAGSPFFSPEGQRINTFDREHLSQDEPMVIRQVPDNGQLSLYVLAQNYSPSTGQPILTCRITHAEGTSTLSFKPEGGKKIIFQTFNIDLSPYRQVSEVSITHSDPIDYACIVPTGTAFKATCYERDGSVYAHFDQNGTVEVYTRDRAGRIVGTTDAQGNTRQSTVHHQTIVKP